MSTLRPLIVRGVTPEEATAKLEAALADCSFRVMRTGSGVPLMWITYHTVIPGTMQPSSYELHVTAWVDVP